MAKAKKPAKKTPARKATVKRATESLKEQRDLDDRRDAEQAGAERQPLVLDTNVEGEQINPFVASGGGKPQSCTPTSNSSSEMATKSPPAWSDSPLPSSPVAADAEPAKPRVTLAGKLAEKKAEPVDTSPHIQVPALAGTGKTTSMVQGLIKIKGSTPSIKPSPQQEAIWEALAVGKSDSVRFSAFNTAITAEACHKLQEAGLTAKGVEGKGIHALGLRSLTSAFPELRKFNLDNAKWVSRDVIAEVLGSNWHDLRKVSGMLPTMNAIDELVSYCKQTLTDPTPEGLDWLTSHYDVEMEGADRRRVYETVPEVLKQSLNPKGRFNYDDMIWLTVKLELPVQKVDLQIIDESQDLNRMQQELMYRAGHRIVFVGDRYQAIYGFSGADAESMDRMQETLTASERRLVTLPLTVTRRCGKAIVEEARKYVPEYEAHESNPSGRIDRQRWSWTGSSREGNRREVPWDQSYRKHVKPGAMVLCRVNAPLVSECFAFLAAGVKASIQGRKIGEGLVSLLKSSGAITVPQLVGWLGDWLAKEQSVENAKRNPSESKLDNLQDKHDCLLAFCGGLSTVDQVTAKINLVFTDSRDNPGVRFSSGHKSKGLEADSVHILQPPGIGPRTDRMQRWELEQEDNLRYVMTTRAIHELTYVS